MTGDVDRSNALDLSESEEEEELEDLNEHFAANADIHVVGFLWLLSFRGLLSTLPLLGTCSTRRKTIFFPVSIAFPRVFAVTYLSAASERSHPRFRGAQKNTVWRGCEWCGRAIK